MQPYWIMGGFIPDNVTGFPENPDYTKSTAIVMQVSQSVAELLAHVLTKKNQVQTVWLANTRNTE